MLLEKRDGSDFGYIKIVFFLLLVLYGHSVIAQQPNFEFKSFNPLSDITSSKTSVIVEDSVGYLWIGTQEGLFRFDGQTIYPYFMEINNPKSLPSSGINNLVLDRDNNLWVGTKEGICKYNREFDYFSRIPDKSNIKGFENKFIKVFTFDNSGRLFVAYNQVIYRYDKPEGQFVEVLKVERGDINTMIFDHQNHLWIGTLSKGALYCYDPQTKQLTTFLNDPNNSQSVSVNEIKTLSICGQTLWIGTLGKGIDTYDLITKTFKHYTFSKNLENYINSIFISRDQKAWVCTLCNLKLFDPVAGLFYNYYNDEGNPYSVGKSLQGVYEDHTGNLWNIHSFGGIRLARSNIPFKHIGGNTDRFWLNSEKLVTSMVNDGMGQFWISKHSFGIDVYNWKKHTTIRLRHQEHNPKSIPDGIIFSIFRDSKNQMWLGSYMGGLQKFNNATNDFSYYRHNPNDSLSVAGNDIRSIAEDTNGDLWLATHREGVDRFDIRKKTFHHYNRKNSYLCDQYTNQVFVDSRGNLWVATVWGLAFLRKGDQIFKNYHNNKNDTTSISNNEIQVIYEDKLNNIWVGTNDGLNKFNYETQTFSRYSSGLKNKHIASILSDKNNNIWVSTSTHISRFNPTTLRFINYNQNNGILSKEFYDRSSCIDSVGNLFFGGSDGYDFFNPDSIKAEVRNPKVVLSDFKLFNKSITCLNDSQIIDRHISYAKKIFLDYFQNSLTFYYQAISLTEANNIEYTYKLEGFDKDWVNAGKERAASYTNLNPGKYTFRVKAKYENGDWNNSETTIELIVHPAWWMTLLFKILLSLLIVAMIFTYIHLRIKRLQNQRERLTELVDERTREIQNKKELLISQALILQEQNDQLKELNATKNKLFSIIGHDLRGPFNVILGFQNILVNDYNNCSEAERIEMVKKTYSTSQKVYSLVENLLNWSRIQTEGIQYNPVQFDVKEIIHRLDLYLNIAEAKGIDLANQVPQGLVAFADINLLQTILRNLISNAIKFTPEGGTIQIKASEQNNVIQISIIDSGIGMSQNQVGNLFKAENNQTRSGTNGEKGSGLGLFLCKEFIEKNMGTITVESQAGKGSTFSFTLPAYPQEYHPFDRQNLSQL
ncbi:MAG TPA: two-component regulator propeller domain-containing protein [Prolixibacteraceae bacterium]|jgi:signal transduction histidine kinase/ligand-binding sensor domain-containing protein